MSRPLLILLAVVAVLLVVLFGLAALDRPVAVTHVEQPVVTNAAAR